MGRPQLLLLVFFGALILPARAQVANMHSYGHPRMLGVQSHMIEYRSHHLSGASFAAGSRTQNVFTDLLVGRSHRKYPRTEC